MLAQDNHDEMVSQYQYAIGKTALNRCYGYISAVQGTNVVAKIPSVCVGEICEIPIYNGETRILAEVISIQGNNAKLCVAGKTTGITINNPIYASGYSRRIEITDAWLGRVVNCDGKFIDEIDEQDSSKTSKSKPRLLTGNRIDPLKRVVIDTPLTTGIKSIDGFITLGVGQRIGIFGEPGVGKSVLLGMITRRCDADIIVLGFIGERGREVGEFLQNELPPHVRSRCVAVVSTSDNSPLERIWGAQLAITVAEYFCDQGKNVLLMIDSLTRFARARREVALQAGELPVRQGYPASVFDELPKLLERAGRSKTGSITGIYTVLHDGDRQNDIISEEIKSLTDGHIQLSHELASSSHYPAIDVLNSKSRVMKQVTSYDHQQSASKILQLLAKHKDVQFLVQVGEYQSGSDSLADLAIEKYDEINNFLKQGINEKTSNASTADLLRQIVQ